MNSVLSNFTGGNKSNYLHVFYIRNYINKYPIEEILKYEVVYK